MAELASSEMFNDTDKTPKKVGGFPVDVIEAVYGPSDAAATEPMVLEDANDVAIAAIERTTAFDPLLGGISCGNRRVTAGTIGAIVFDRTSGQPMILSNWHILAGASAAVVGEGILQPGGADGGTEVVATLTRMRLDTRMDAAVATLNSARGYARDILGLGPISGTEAATLGMLVVKSGRTTGITRGVVDGVSMSVSINYVDPGVITFTNQIRIVPRAPWPAVDYEVSMGGDSGSIWLNEANNRAIGLHFAGERDPLPASENAVCTPIELGRDGARLLVPTGAVPAAAAPPAHRHLQDRPAAVRAAGALAAGHRPAHRPAALRSAPRPALRPARPRPAAWARRPAVRRRARLPMRRSCRRRHADPARRLARGIPEAGALR